MLAAENHAQIPQKKINRSLDAGSCQFSKGIVSNVGYENSPWVRSTTIISTAPLTVHLKIRLHYAYRTIPCFNSSMERMLRD